MVEMTYTNYTLYLSFLLKVMTHFTSKAFPLSSSAFPMRVAAYLIVSEMP